MTRSVSIVVATMNNAPVLRRTLNGLLKLRYAGKYEIIVVDDGSTDETKDMLKREFSGRKKVKIICIPHSGVCVARNTGICNSSGEIVVTMDHDCIPEPLWLNKLVGGFSSERVGIVSSYGYYGGTSTAFRRELIERVGGYDEAYVYYREDTDLSFKIMELGYEFKLVDAPYEHDHELARPRGLAGAVTYVFQRWRYHMNDVLLYKNHPVLARNFLNVKFGFLVNPLADFRAATGLWKGVYELSSPRGITFMESKSVFHNVLIFFTGLVYMMGVKLYRLMGSLKCGRLLL